MLWTIDDLDDLDETHYDDSDLDWHLEDDAYIGGRFDNERSALPYIATLRLHEGDTGPCGAAGPCLVVYRKIGYNGNPTARITPLA